MRKDIEKLVDSQKADQESSAVTPMTDKEIVRSRTYSVRTAIQLYT